MSEGEFFCKRCGWRDVLTYAGQSECLACSPAEDGPTGYFGDVDIAAAEPLCNCCHSLSMHVREYCAMCRCGGFVKWGTE